MLLFALVSSKGFCGAGNGASYSVLDTAHIDYGGNALESVEKLMGTICDVTLEDIKNSKPRYERTFEPGHDAAKSALTALAAMANLIAEMGTVQRR
jgi:hypothetical protein